MLKISEFFKKIQNRHTKELFVRSVVRDSLKKIVNVEVPVEAISFKSSIAVLKDVSQSARSQIFIKKQTIIQEINSLQSIRIVEDIR